MITVQEANDIIGQYALPLGSEEVELAYAIGRVTQENILSDRPFPPFDRVMMDGIALRYVDYTAMDKLHILGTQAAGQAPMKLKAGAHAIEIMTGAVLPDDADTVIRYEDLDINDHQVCISKDATVNKGQNIHREGTDRAKGDVLIPSGTHISAAEIGVAATVGKTKIRVKSLPRITVISTGDELVDIHQQPLLHQIRKSNSHQLQAFFKSHNIPCSIVHIQDEISEIKSVLSELLKTNDALILSGGVSMGKFDYLPQALAELGVEEHFHKIAQRPGKPMWFGTSNAPSCTVFALPGNPVSTFNCCIRYVLPWLQEGMGINRRNRSAILNADFSFKLSLTYFLQVKTDWLNGQLLANPNSGKGSGDLANLVEVDGFLELPANRVNFYKGESFPYHPFR